MAKTKKIQRPIYKLSELNADLAFTDISYIAGFSVSVNTPYVDQEKFKQHFRSDFLAILLVTKGKLTLSVNLQKYTAVKNDVVIISPHTIKQIVKVEMGSTITAIGFTADFLTKIGLPKNLQEQMDYYSSQYAPIWHLAPKDAAVITSQARQLEQRVKNWGAHPYSQELLHHQFQVLLYEMAAFSKKYAQQVNVQLNRKENLVIQFAGLVQQQCKRQRSVQEYARQLNISPKYLTETVKEITGKTAGEIIDDNVLLEAKFCLGNPEASIAQIADELNFSDQSFFGKFFKRFTGLSPKEYRLSM